MIDDLELLYAGGAKNAHDAFFKTVFRHPANALALVKAVAPPELAAGLDPASFRLEHCTFVTEELEQKHADLLFWAKLHGRDTLVYFLFEHLSTSRAEAALTMYRYAGEALRHAYDTLLPGGQRRGLPLPAILPVVVHHSATGWQHATSLRDLYALDGVPESLYRYLPQVEFLLDDMSALSDEQLLARDVEETRGQVALTLMCLRDGRDGERAATTLGRFAHLLAAPTVSSYFKMQLFTYLLVVSRLQPAQALDILVRVLPQEEEAIMTAGEQLMQQGRAEGEARGEVKKARHYLRMQLTAKYGPIGDLFERRIEAASPEQLDAWVMRVLEAPTLADIFKD